MTSTTTAISSKPVDGAWYDQIVAKWENKLENLGLESVEIGFADLSKPESSAYFKTDYIELETLLTEMGIEDKYSSVAYKLGYYRLIRAGNGMISDMDLDKPKEIRRCEQRLLEEMDQQVVNYVFKLKDQMLAELKQAFAELNQKAA